VKPSQGRAVMTEDPVTCVCVPSLFTCWTTTCYYRAGWISPACQHRHINAISDRETLRNCSRRLWFARNYSTVYDLYFKIK